MTDYTKESDRELVYTGNAIFDNPTLDTNSYLICSINDLGIIPFFNLSSVNFKKLERRAYTSYTRTGKKYYAEEIVKYQKIINENPIFTKLLGNNMSNVIPLLYKSGIVSKENRLENIDIEKFFISDYAIDDIISIPFKSSMLPRYYGSFKSKMSLIFMGKFTPTSWYTFTIFGKVYIMNKHCLIELSEGKSKILYLAGVRQNRIVDYVNNDFFNEEYDPTLYKYYLHEDFKSTKFPLKTFRSHFIKASKLYLKNIECEIIKDSFVNDNFYYYSFPYFSTLDKQEIFLTTISNDFKEWLLIQKGITLTDDEVQTYLEKCKKLYDTSLELEIMSDEDLKLILDSEEVAVPYPALTTLPNLVEDLIVRTNQEERDFDADSWMEELPVENEPVQEEVLSAYEANSELSNRQS